MSDEASKSPVGGPADEELPANVLPSHLRAQARLAARLREVGMWHWDPVSDGLSVSPHLRDLLGLDTVVLPMGQLLGAMPSADATRVRLALDELRMGAKQAIQLQYRVSGADGGIRWLEAICEAARDGDGRLVRVYGATRDITEHVALGEQLRRSDGFWRAALDSMQAQVVIVDDSGVIVAVNDVWRQVGQRCGATSDYIGVNYLSVCERAPEPEAASARNGIADVLAQRRDCFALVYACEGPVTRQWFGMRVTGYVAGGRRYAVIAHEDRSARRAQSELRSVQAALLDEAGEALVGIDAEGRIVAWNAGAEALYGYAAQDVLHRPAELVMAGQPPGPAPSGAGEYESTQRRKDGSRFTAGIRVGTLRGDGGSPLARTVAVRAIQGT